MYNCVMATNHLDYSRAVEAQYTLMSCIMIPVSGEITELSNQKVVIMRSSLSSKLSTERSGFDGFSLNASHCLRFSRFHPC